MKSCDEVMSGKILPSLMKMIDGLNPKIKQLKNTAYGLIKQRSFRYGVPFVLLIVGGSFTLQEWTQVRYQFARVKGVTKEEAEKMGLHREKEVTLEDAYEDIQKLDIENWENKRGPRPWEMTEQKKK